MIGPSPLRKSVLSLNAMAAAAVSASPLKALAAAPPANDDLTDEPNIGSPPKLPTDPPGPIKEVPVLLSQPVAGAPPDEVSIAGPIELIDSRVETRQGGMVEKPVKARPPLPASAANAFAQALGSTLAEASQPLFMRRNKKPLEPLQTATGGARRVPGRDLPGPARPADVSKAGLVRQDVSAPLESSAAMQENVGVGGQNGGQQKPPAGPKPGHARLKSSRGRSLDNRSWKGAAEVAQKHGDEGWRSENGGAPMLQRRVGAENKADAKSGVAKDAAGSKKSSLGRARSSGGSARSSLGEMDENAKGGVGKPVAQLRLAPTAVGRLKGRKSETAGLVRASSPRVEKVRAAWKLRRSMNVELGAKKDNVRGGGSKKVVALLEERMNNLSITEEEKEMKGQGSGAVENAGAKWALSPQREGTDDQPPPSSMEKAGQLLRRMGAAVGALLGSVSPLEKQKPNGGEGKQGGEDGKVARMLQFEEGTQEPRRKGSFLAPPDEPKPCTGVEPEEPEESPRGEGEKLERGRGKRRSLLQRLGGASRKARERSHTPRGRGRKEGARKRGTPGAKGGSILQ